jgi:hypothetical protein
MKAKFHVSIEAARLLKEKGYNEECDYIIDDDGDIFEDKYRINQDLSEWKWSCPTKDEAIDWLESKGIVVCVYLLNVSTWGYNIIVHNDKHIFGDFFEDKNRLETEEAAIIKALELL